MIISSIFTRKYTSPTFLGKFYYHLRFADYSHRLPVTWVENSGEGDTPSQILEDRGKGVAKGQPRSEELSISSSIDGGGSFCNIEALYVQT